MVKKTRDLKKVLITGADGMVGSYVDFGIKTNRRIMDITDLGKTMAVIKKHKPWAVVHLAAETDVDHAEEDPMHAYLINSVGTYNVALAAKQVGAKIIYISTAGVFDGKKDKPYSETDEPAPPNVYGHTKYLGELAVKSMSNDYIIIRSCWMFGGGPSKDKKFIAKIIGQLDKKEVKALNDAFGSPTYAKDLVKAIKKLLQENSRGIFHVSNKGRASRFEIAKKIASVMGPKVKVIPVDSSYFKLPAERGKNEMLVSTKIDIMRPWQEALEEYLKTEWGEKHIPDFTHQTTCRVCGSSDLAKVFELGAMPLANSFLKKNELSKEEKSFPLTLYFCRNCGLVGLSDVVSPRILFHEYPYLTSASAPLIKHFKSLANEIKKTLPKNKKSFVLEIGSNDGSLLLNFKNFAKILGVDPAVNVSRMARKRGVKTITALFNAALASEIEKEYGKADAIIANNVVAHVNELHDFFSGIKTALKPGGNFIFEIHWLGNLIGPGGFDQIYHEHLSYFSLSALKHLIKTAGLKIINAKLVPIHGESLQVWVSNTGKPSAEVKKIMIREKNMGLTDETTLISFQSKAEDIKKKLYGLIQKIKKERGKIAGYGAPAKGNTLLNFCNIGKNSIDYIVDSTPFKHGTYTPGTKIPIFPEKKLEKDRPDYVLLLAWNYADAILEKEKKLREKGTKFIIPIPKVKIT